MGDYIAYAGTTDHPRSKIHLTWTDRRILCRTRKPTYITRTICGLTEADGGEKTAKALHDAGIVPSQLCMSCFRHADREALADLIVADEPCEECGADAGERCRPYCTSAGLDGE